MAAETPRFVVLSYGAGPAGRCVDVLLRSGCPPEHVLVVHNRSPLDERPSDIPTGVRLVDTGGNLGYGAGMNVGIRVWRESGLPMVLVTHDVEITYPAARSLVDCLRNRSDAVVAAPLLLTPDGITVSAGGNADRWGNVSHLRAPRSTTPYPVDWVDGAVLALAPTAPELPEEFFLYFEDVAYSVDLGRAGLRSYMVPNAVAVTVPGAGGRPQAFRYFYWRNRIAFAKQSLGLHGTAGTLLFLLGALTVRVLQELKAGHLGESLRVARLYVAAGRHGIFGPLGAPSAKVSSLLKNRT